MATATRTQNRYDHRLRELVRTTQDISCAVQHGVPRSTARGWLSAPTAQVVTVDALNMDVTQLRREVLRLQTRIRKLIALVSRIPIRRSNLGGGAQAPMAVPEQARYGCGCRVAGGVLREGTQFTATAFGIP